VTLTEEEQLPGPPGGRASSPLQRCAGLAAVALRAPATAIVLGRAGALEVAAAAGAGITIEGPWPFRSLPVAVAERVVATGSPVTAADTGAARLGPPAPETPAAALGVPITGRDGSVIGACVALADPGRVWDDQDLGALEALSSNLATEFDLQAAQDAAAAASRRLAAFREVADALAVAVTPADVARVVVERAAPAMGAAGAVVVRVTPDGEQLEVVNHHGYDHLPEESLQRLALQDRLPLCEAARRRQPVLLGTARTSRRRYPASASIPLLSGGQLLGVLGLSYGAERTFTDEEAAALVTLAQPCALALERALLLEGERRARGRAEKARDRLAFLAEATRLLSSSLDLSATLATLADLTVPSLAAWASIDLVDETGRVRHLADSHARPEPARRFDPVQLLGGHSRTASDLAAGILAADHPLQFEITPALLDQLAHSPEHRDELASFEIRWALAVPLKAESRTLGVLTLGATDAGAPFGPDDVALAEELGRRAGVALDNARLHRASQDAAASRQEALALLDGVLTSAPVGFALFDLDLRFLRVNEALAAITGLPAEDHVGRTVEETAVLPPEVGEDLRQVLRTGSPVVNREVSVSAPSSRRVKHLLVGCYAVRGDADEIVGAGTTVVEITDRVEAEQDTIALADVLRRALLPSDLPRIDGVELASAYLYGGGEADVGGDFYDVFDLGRGGGWSLAIGDVCGTGPEAASVTSLARHTIRAAAMQARRPSVVLTLLNEALRRQPTERPFCTVAYGNFHADDTGARVTLASGGHPLPLVLRADGTITEVGTPGTLLGVFDAELLTLVDVDVRLEVGDTLVLFTDGVTEAQGPTGMFGEERLAEVLAACAGLDAQGVVDAVIGALLRFSNSDRNDDIAVLAVRSTGRASAPAPVVETGVREDFVRLDEDPASAGGARRFVEARLAAWGGSAVLDSALLLTSELVANAVRHAGGRVGLRLLSGSGSVRIEVHDCVPTLPAPRRPSIDDESGRGLALVDALSSRWGVTQMPDGGKSVWFEVDDPDRG
jgi:PAS domain S-box-containing protein